MNDYSLGTCLKRLLCYSLKTCKLKWIHASIFYKSQEDSKNFHLPEDHFFKLQFETLWQVMLIYLVDHDDH